MGRYSPWGKYQRLRRELHTLPGKELAIQIDIQPPEVVFEDSLEPLSDQSRVKSCGPRSSQKGGVFASVRVRLKARCPVRDAGFEQVFSVGPI